MNFFQLLFKKKTNADKIADARHEFFEKFYGSTTIKSNGRDWIDADDAMRLADKIVAWMYSPAPRQQPDASCTHSGRH